MTLCFQTNLDSVYGIMMDAYAFGSSWRTHVSSKHMTLSHGAITLNGGMQCLWIHFSITSYSHWLHFELWLLYCCCVNACRPTLYKKPCKPLRFSRILPIYWDCILLVQFRHFLIQKMFACGLLCTISRLLINGKVLVNGCRETDRHLTPVITVDES